METQLLKEVINTEIKDLINLKMKIVRYLTLFEFLPLILSILMSFLIDNRIFISIMFFISVFFILTSDYLLFKIFHKLKLSKKILNNKELKIIEIVGFDYTDKSIFDIREIITKYIIKNTTDKNFEQLLPDLFKMISDHNDKDKLENLINYRKKLI